MSSFDTKIAELIRLLGRPATAVNARQGDKVFNFHYDPNDWATLRHKLPMLQKRLSDEGFTPHLHSLADIIQDIFQENEKVISALQKQEHRFVSHEKHTETLYNILARKRTGEPLSLDSPIVQRIEGLLQEAAKTPQSIVLLTDIEMAHPIIRVSAFEQVLQGRFTVPCVFFYPGKKGSRGDNPSFLGVYPSDGNYRSQHIR